MLLLTATTDKIQLVTSAARTVDVVAAMVDHTLSTDNVEGKKQLTAITTATTTDIVSVPTSGDVRNVKLLNIRNKDTSSVDVTVVFDANGTDYELHKVTLAAGECLEYVEGVGWFISRNASKLDVKLRVSADVTNATTSFADITGLTCPVESGKNYGFEAHLIHQTNASTTGAQFGVNGPTMSNLIVSTIDTVTASVTASVHSAGTVTALDTAATAQTTGPGTVNVLAILCGSFTPSAAGTFAIRSKSEVAVASGLIIKAGSWCHLFETDN